MEQLIIMHLPNIKFHALFCTTPIRLRLISLACGKVCELLVQDKWFSLCTLASPTSKTYHCDMTEILFKVALNLNQTIKQTLP